MQSAIGSGDYKLYKNHIDEEYEFYRLYKDCKREDLDEKFDISEQSVEIVQDLSKRLEKYIEDNNAQYFHKNPLEKKII